jgi:hypothetical protein
MEAGSLERRRYPPTLFCRYEIMTACPVWRHWLPALAAEAAAA